MPRYDYRCKAGHRYEKQEPFGSPVEHPCEKCGKTAQRQLSTPTVIFKGGGWYKTDSRDGSHGKTSASESGASDSDAKSGAKSEEKAKAKEAPDTIDKKASKSKKAGSAAAD